MKNFAPLILCVLSISHFACGVDDYGSSKIDRLRCRLVTSSTTVTYDGSPSQHFRRNCSWSANTQRCVTGSPNGDETSVHEYNEFGHLIRSTYGGEEWQYEYDCSGAWCKLLSQSRSSVPTGSDESDYQVACTWSGNQQTCIADDEHTTISEYNRFGYVLTESRRDSFRTAQTEYQYDCSDRWCRVLASATINTNNELGRTSSYDTTCSWNDDQHSHACGTVGPNGYRKNIVSEYDCKTRP